MIKNLLIVAGLALASISYGADYEEQKGYLFETGVSAPMPALFNLNLGYWGTDIPILARVSGMYWGNVKGLQGDVGLVLDSEGDFKQYLAITALTFTRASGGDWVGVGPAYGFNLYGFMFHGGLSFGSGISQYSSVLGPSANIPYSSPQIVLQIGYSSFH